MQVLRRKITATAFLLAVGAAAVTVSPRTTAGQEPASLTFYKEVLPILQKHCQACHRPGHIAPMSFLTYAETRPWAKAMKEAVLTRKMPPWFADPAHGRFKNDRTLPSADIDIITRWVEA